MIPYTVTLTDLGVYTLTVAASSEKQACDIAKTVLHDDVTSLSPDMAIASRQTDAVAEAAEPSLQMFRVHAQYTVDFSICVPAGNREDAERHAKRLYQDQPFAWENDINDERLRWLSVQQVVS